MRILDRFDCTGRKLTEQEKEAVQEMEAKYEGVENTWPFAIRPLRPPSRIQQRFDRQGRELFEHEKPIVEAFNKKYEEELAQVRAMQKVVGVRENPFPRRFDPCDVRVLKERKAVVAYLRAHGSTLTADAIENGEHLAANV